MKSMFSPEEWAFVTRFVAEVRDRFSHQPDKYRSFVGFVCDIARNGIPEDVVNRIKAILQGHDDLIHKLSAFLPSGSTSRAIDITEEDNRNHDPLALPATIPLAPSEEMVKEDDEEVGEEEIEEEEETVYSVESFEKQGIRFCQQVQRMLARAEDYFAFLNLFHCYSSGKIVKDRFQNRVVRLIGKRPDLKHKFKLFLNCCENFYEIEGEKAERRFKRQKLGGRKKGRDWKKEDDYAVKYISPSYWLLPKDHPVAATATERTRHKSGDLNDCCVAKPPKAGSGNYERDRYTESLEDLWQEEKCEVDVLLHWIQSAQTCEKELMDGTPLDKVEGLSGILFKRCVERLYGDHGPEILVFLKESHKVAVPVVIARLKQKQEELETFNKEFDEEAKRRRAGEI